MVAVPFQDMGDMMGEPFSSSLKVGVRCGRGSVDGELAEHAQSPGFHP